MQFFIVFLNEKIDVLTYIKKLNIYDVEYEKIDKYKEYLITTIALFFAWILTPLISYLISDTKEKKKNLIKRDEKEILIDVAKRTWNYFKDYMNKENNFLPPDNYQEGRKNLITKNTSSTNIGLRITCNYYCKRSRVHR